MDKQYNYPDIIKVFSTSREETVNEYLEIGWVLLNIVTDCHDDPKFSEYTVFTLGWDKTNGELKEPQYISDMPF